MPKPELFTDEFTAHVAAQRETESLESREYKREVRQLIVIETAKFLSEEPCPCPPDAPGAVVGRRFITLLEPQETPARRMLEREWLGSDPSLETDELDPVRKEML